TGCTTKITMKIAVAKAKRISRNQDFNSARTFDLAAGVMSGTGSERVFSEAIWSSISRCASVLSSRQLNRPRTGSEATRGLAKTQLVYAGANLSSHPRSQRRRISLQGDR